MKTKFKIYIPEYLKTIKNLTEKDVFLYVLDNCITFEEVDSKFKNIDDMDLDDFSCTLYNSRMDKIDNIKLFTNENYWSVMEWNALDYINYGCICDLMTDLDDYATTRDLMNEVVEYGCRNIISNFLQFVRDNYGKGTIK